MGWSPAGRKSAARFLALSFDNDPPAPAPRTLSLGVYMLFTGPLDPLITAVRLQILPEGGSEAVSVRIFDAAAGDASPALVCPGITHFNVSSDLVVSRSRLTAAAFSTSTVIGARVDFNDDPLDASGDLPVVAAVGLFLNA
ncbi:hypothetical protein PLESTB_001793600 [Pleodorina starrii]|uniref:Uncharacterized protein n=1 Tax=Pleodorina starrii TaxID=330485 RepID=A0A9W6C221_9CHLO|nr:hypothetical protein PLESTM_001157800 [Pleodorina starrii]GLC61701.1 hypothetical protein PLESTB_001793600 [Pleodorina starrii]GLC69180.1 hypothetical protein PLESTF_000799200 [Pleodorina starrii]